MVSLGGSEEVLAIGGSKDIVVPYVPVVGTRQKMRHANRRRQSMSRYRVREGTDGFHYV